MIICVHQDPPLDLSIISVHLDRNGHPLEAIFAFCSDLGNQNKLQSIFYKFYNYSLDNSNTFSCISVDFVAFEVWIVSVSI